MSALVELLPKMFPGLLDDRVFDYSTGADFEKLWKFEGLPTDRIVIAWARTAPDPDLAPINAADCLSPLDWAAAYMKQLKQLAIAPANWPEILVLDAAPESHINVPTLAHFHTLRRDQLPWLTVPANPGLNDILEWCAKTKPSPVPADYKTHCENALTRFLREIRLNLTDVRSAGDYDRHSISNIVAPMVLLGRAAKTTIHSKALHILLSSCSLCVDESVEDSEVADDGNELQILLLDDQAEHGWTDWLKNVLPKARVETLKSPIGLVESLQKQLDIAGTKDVRFHLQLPDLENAKNPVLLLDLRLFSGSSANELKFYKEAILPLVNRFADKPDLAWPSFSSRDKMFRWARKSVNNGRLAIDTPQHHEALTWLPRIIALADMSLPVILFSSTDRAALKSRLEAYGSIYTGLQKPKPTAGNVSGIVDLLGSAIKNARSMLDARTKCQGIEQMAVTRPGADQQLETIHVELYIDEDKESDKASFAVGGVFAVFADPMQADQFEDVCVEKGLRYFEETYFQPCSRSLDKYSDIGRYELGEALQCFRNNSGFINLGHLRLRRGRLGEGNHHLQSDAEDQRFWKLLEALIEVFTSDSLPALLEQYKASKATVSVFVGTRMVSYDGCGHFTYRGNVPIHWFEKGGMLRGMGERDAFPIVQKAIQLHANAELTIERAVALALPYKGGTKSRIDRVIHRPARVVFCFNNIDDTEIAPLQLPSFASYGRVVRRGRGRNATRDEFVFVSVSGLPDNVFCFWRNCAEFDQLQQGSVVCLDVEQGDRGFQGANVRIADELTLETWLDGMQPQVSSRFLDGRHSEDFRPDYRALHYVADQIMRNSTPFADLIPEDGAAGQFDEDHSPALEAAIAASRFLDTGELPSAVRSFSISPAENRTHHRHLARSHMAFRLWNAIRECSGATFLESISMPVIWQQGSGESGAAGYRVQKQQAKTQVRHGGASHREKAVQLAEIPTLVSSQVFAQSALERIGSDPTTEAQPTQGLFLSPDWLIFTGFECDNSVACRALRTELQKLGFQVNEAKAQLLKARSWKQYGVRVSLNRPDIDQLLGMLTNGWLKISDGSHLFCERAGAMPSEKRAGVMIRRSQRS
jgi:cold shock CspA family protein